MWALLSVSMVHDEEGDPLYFVSQIQDISERKRAEQKIRAAEQRYRTLVEQIPAVTYIDPVDDPETSLYTSPQIEQMLGYTPQEWQNEKLWPKRLHPDDRERILAADKRFEAGGGEPFREEYRPLAKDDSVVWVREEAVLVRDEAGEPLYWQGVFYDLTERKALEERLHYQAFHDYLTDLPNPPALHGPPRAGPEAHQEVAQSGRRAVHGPGWLQGRKRLPRSRGGRPSLRS